MEAFRARKVEISFVDGNHLNDGGKFREDGGDAVAPFGIFFVMAIEENRVRAETPGGAKRHGGVNPEFASFVAGRRDYASLVGPAADNDRLATKVGAIEEFDGNKKGVHIHMEDGGVEGNLLRFGGIVLGAEASQVRHGISLRLRNGGGNAQAGGRQSLRMGVEVAIR